LVHTSRQIKTNKTKTTKTNKPRRPANPPARLAFRQRKQQTKNRTKHNQRGRSPNATPTRSICQGTQWFDHCITFKNMRNELKPRNLSRHESLACLPISTDIEVLKTVHEHELLTDASLSVLSEQLVQQSSMDKVVTINRREQESRGGLNARHPPLRGRTGMAHRKHHRSVKQNFQAAIANAVQTPSFIGEENKNCSVVDLSQRNVWAVLAKMRDTQQSCSCADSMQPNKVQSPHSNSKGGLNLSMTVHASSATLVLPSAKLFSL